MKNKRLLSILGILIIVVIAAIGIQSFSKKSTTSSSSSSVAKVGVLQFVTHEALDTIYKGIQAGLKEEGYSGDNLKIDFLNAEADQSKIATMSQTLVEHKNDVLIGIATPAAQGLANATSTIPVIMGAVTDPVGAKLVKSLDNPGGNVTGVSDKTPIASELTLMNQIMPDMKTIGVIYSSSEDNSKLQVEEFKKLAAEKGYTVEEYAVSSTNDIATTMSVMLPKVDAVWVPLDNTIASAFTSVVSAAKDAKKPIFPSVDTMVSEGGLASVYIDQYQLGVETGKMTAKVLKGQDVSTLPVEVLEKGSPIINTTVAAELGITIPDDVLSSAKTVE